MHKGEISRFLKEFEYKDISTKAGRCSRYKSIICVDNNEQEGRYCKTNKNHFVSFKLIFLLFILNRLTSSSACFGDSGGPMHKTKNGRTTIVGLTSGSNNNIFKDHLIFYCTGPTIYTRVGYYLKWIEEVVGGTEEHC